MKMHKLPTFGLHSMICLILSNIVISRPSLAYQGTCYSSNNYRVQSTDPGKGITMVFRKAGVPIFFCTRTLELVKLTIISDHRTRACMISRGKEITFLRARLKSGFLRRLKRWQTRTITQERLNSVTLCNVHYDYSGLR